MKLLYRQLFLQRRFVALCLGFATLTQLFGFADPLIVRRLIDHYALRSGEMSGRAFAAGVATWLAVGVGAALLSRAFRSLQDYFLISLTQRVGSSLYTEGVRHVLEWPYAAFEGARSGEVLSHLTRVRRDAEQFIFTSVNTLFVAVVAIVFGAAYAFTIHWSIAPLMVGMAVLITRVATRLSRRVREMHRTVVRESAALAGTSTESLRNIELVKSLGLERQETLRLESSIARLLRLELNKVRYLRSIWFVQGTVVNLARTLALGLILFLIFMQEVTMGQLFALLLYSLYIFGPLQELGRVMGVFREAEASMQVYQEILDTPRAPVPANPEKPAALDHVQFDGVTFRYATATEPALRGVSFEARRGDTIAFVGPSGSGKTTMVKLLTGLYAPDEGRIVYGGIPDDRVDMAAVRARVGLVAQETLLFAGTIAENLRYTCAGATDDECRAALRSAACDALIERGSDGLQNRIGEHGLKLSGGERQRLAIARALLRRPEVLIFDEATSSLDSLTEAAINRTVEEIVATDRVITIIIAHRLATAARADRIYVLQRGEVVEQGRHEELLREKGLYYAMWRQQTGEGGHRPGDPLELPTLTIAPAAPEPV